AALTVDGSARVVDSVAWGWGGGSGGVTSVTSITFYLVTTTADEHEMVGLYLDSAIRVGTLQCEVQGRVDYTLWSRVEDATSFNSTPTDPDCAITLGKVGSPGDLIEGSFHGTLRSEKPEATQVHNVQMTFRVLREAVSG